jgi:macrolide transport system ATP-binding/permease protein/lipoprotein-releasing system ATP-binding protein
VNETDYQAAIDKLSDGDKDRLIVRLWHDLQDERARSKELAARLAGVDGSAAAGAAKSSLAETLQREGSSVRRPSGPRTSSRFGTGAGLGLLRSRFLLGLIVVVAAAFALDYAVGRYQDYRRDQKRLADLQLQHAAYEGLFAEVVSVAYEPDEKSYRLTMKMTNIEPTRPIFVMQSPVRAFVQSGLTWKEVPARSANGETASVVRLAGPHTYETIFEPNLADWTELIPGYMHVRFELSSLISERSDPDDDIIERTDRYYVYLKPHGADDDAIRRRMNYRGVPPVYMPMPPH